MAAAVAASFRMSSSAPSTSSSSSSSYTPLLRLSRRPSRIRVTSTTTTRGARLTFTLKCDLTSSSSSSSDSPLIRHAAGSNASTISALQLLKTSAAADRYTKERSSIIVIGLNVHTAPVHIREKLSIPEPQWAQSITDLCALPHIEEAAVLSTCNRIEIYVVALSQHRGVKEVTEWMSKISGVPVPDLCQHRFLLYNNQATQHLFEVSSGLDSLVLGEGQILSQVKQVVKSGQGLPGFARNISGLFKHAITVGKRVRTETNISTGSVSVSSAAVDLALIKLPPQSSSSSFANSRVMVVGAGKMGKLVIKHLIAKGCTSMVVVNRTEDKVAAILKEVEEDGVDIIYRPFSEILKTAAESDVIFTCTASEVALFTKEQVQSLPSGSGRRLFIDISVPRNVEPGVSSVEGVCLYNVDDLKEVVTANKEERSRKAMEAGMIIMNEVGEFEAWKDSLETVPTIKKLRAYAERIRSSEVDKCLSKMGNDITKQQREAVHHLSLGIVNKLLHGPMQHLRCNAGDDDRSLSEVLENMHALNRIFGLDTDVSDLEDKIRSKIERTKSQTKIDR